MQSLKTHVFIHMLVFFLILDEIYSWKNNKIGTFKSSTLNRRCKSPNGDLANAEYLEHNTGRRNREYRTYKCHAGYVMNIPEAYTFHCILSDEGTFIWRYNSMIRLENVTCEPKAKCSTPPTTPPGTERIDNMRYMLNKGSTEYFTGDIVEYKCKDGYETPVEDYYDYYNEKDDETNTVSCDESGLWNGKNIYSIKISPCEEIQCNATRFASVTNGNITDYMDFYPYQGEIMLTCDPGYRPINDISSITCTDRSDFEISSVSEFGCEEIRCPVPIKPLNGNVRYSQRSVGSNLTYFCFGYYELIGDAVWTCKEDGEWDHNCVLCSREDSYCRPPCIPLGAKMTTQDTDFELGSVITFTCKNGKVYGGTTNRTCLRNRDWSGTEIDCIGDSLFDVNVGKKLMSAMEHINENKTINDTSEMDFAESRSMNIGYKGGVDVYILLDVSASITSSKKFDETKRFIKTLLPEIGISKADSGTRLTLITFASTFNIEFNRHYLTEDDNEDWDVFESYEEPQRIIDELKKNSLAKSVGKGTAISDALNEVRTDVETKKGMFANGLLTRDAQQVLILLSDGEYTTGGFPDVSANKLKALDVEIYSIAVGRKGDGTGFKVMEAIASVKENEQHFFAINGLNLDDVLKAMISKGPNECCHCGLTKPHKTMYNNESVSYDIEAKENAWPWMVRLVGGGQHICGGSMISKRWILTAAHCFDKREVTKVQFKRIDISMANHNGFDKMVENHIRHPKYDQNIDPHHLYDVALVKLMSDVPDFDEDLLPICIWNKTETSEEAYKKLFEPDTYGVVTGWGLDEDGHNSDILKQIQIPIQRNDQCATQKRSDFNETVMFCAGGKEIVDGQEKIIDACTGDSGGPFIVKHPNTDKKNTFIQTGIVSWGYGCRKKNVYGIYTRLTPDIVTWIRKTTDAEPIVA